jgi:hypothetical protein
MLWGQIHWLERPAPATATKPKIIYVGLAGSRKITPMAAQVISSPRA